jgi:hypothetical protein
MNDPLYMLKWSSRSYPARYTVTLVTSRDCSHITWFRNSASVSLLATLSHRTWIASDFFFFLSSQLLQKRSKNLRLHFLKNFLQTKIFFLTHLLYAKSAFNSDRKLYKKKWCNQMRTWFSFHWKNWFIIWLHRWLSIVAAKERTLIDFHRLLSKNVFAERLTIQFLKRRETEQICLWLMILLDRQLSFDRWARKFSRWNLRSLFLWWSEFEYRCALFVRETENSWSEQWRLDCSRILLSSENIRRHMSAESSDFVIR